MLLLSLVVACSGNSGGFSEPTFLEKGEQLKAADQSRALRFSVTALENPLELAETFHPVLKYVSEKLGRPVLFVPVRDSEQLVQALVKREIDIAWLDPSAYLEARRQADVHVVVRSQKKDGGGVTAVIVVRNDSPVKSLRDLAGKSFALGDSRTTFSSVLPKSMLRQSGLALGDLGRMEYLGTMDNCAQNVLNGAYTAAGIKDSIYEKFRTRAIGLRVISRSEKYPAEPIVAREGLSSEVVENLRRTLLGLRETEVLESISPDQGVFVPASAADYDVYRALE